MGNHSTLKLKRGRYRGKSLTATLNALIGLKKVYGGLKRYLFSFYLNSVIFREIFTRYYEKYCGGDIYEVAI